MSATLAKDIKRAKAFHNKIPGWSVEPSGVEEIMTARFLFADPSFLMGMARVLDLTGQFDEYNMSITPEEADAMAFWCDWIVVGHDLRDAFEQFSTEFSGPAEVNTHYAGSRHEQTLLPLRR